MTEIQEIEEGSFANKIGEKLPRRTPNFKRVFQLRTGTEDSADISQRAKELAASKAALAYTIEDCNNKGDHISGGIKTALEGDWIGGKINEGPVKEDLNLSVSGTNMIMSGSDTLLFSGTCRIQTGIDIHQIEILVSGSVEVGNIGKRILGIFKITDDRLSLSMSKPGALIRPVDFSPTDTDVYQFRRQNSEEKKL